MKRQREREVDTIKIEDNLAIGYVEIEGIRYDHEFFRSFGENGLKIGETFRLVQRENGVLTVEAL